MTLLVSQSLLEPLLTKQAGVSGVSLYAVFTLSNGYVSLEDSKSSPGGDLAARESGGGLAGDPMIF